MPQPHAYGTSRGAPGSTGVRHHAPCGRAPTLAGVWNELLESSAIVQPVLIVTLLYPDGAYAYNSTVYGDWAFISGLDRYASKSHGVRRSAETVARLTRP